MTKKELLELIKDMPDNAMIKIFDDCSPMCVGVEVEQVDYNELRNEIFIS